MNRRAFLTLLSSGALGAAAHTLDLDRLLWRPGAKTIFLPPAPELWAVDQATGIRMRFAKAWELKRLPPSLVFHKEAFQFIMEPIDPGPFRLDMIEGRGYFRVTKAMSRPEFARRYPNDRGNWPAQT